MTYKTIRSTSIHINTGTQRKTSSFGAILRRLSGQRIDPIGEIMQPLAIDLQGVTSDLLHPTDNPVLAAAVEEAINPSHPIADGAGFDNKL
jgi:hypothetical protein